MKPTGILPLAVAALGCAGSGASRADSPAVAQAPECKPFKGRFPPFTPGVTELRGTLEVPMDLEGKMVYVALDYSTAEGKRRSIAVGTLETPERTMRFQCMLASPRDAAFWKWVVIAPPAESCGYYAEATGETESAVSVTCEASRVFAWDAYKSLFENQ